MGQGTNGVADASSPPPERLEREVETIRGNLDGIVSELDRRRHELTDWRLQLRRHRTQLIAAGASLAAIMASFVVFTFWRHHRAKRLRGQMSLFARKAHDLRAALARALEDPDKVAKPSPSIGHKIAAAVGTTAAAALTKRAVQHWLSSPPPARPIAR